MAIQLLLAATLRTCVADYDSLKGYQVEVTRGTTVRRLVRQLALPEADIKLIMVNGIVARLDTVLEGDERVALFPPVGGG
jgi:molybdopterin synthase sulfur carrier subunit